MPPAKKPLSIRLIIDERILSVGAILHITEIQDSSREIHSLTIFFTTNPTIAVPRLKTVLRGDKRTANCPRYGMANVKKYVLNIVQ